MLPRVSRQPALQGCIPFRECKAKTCPDGSPGTSVFDHCRYAGYVAEGLLRLLPSSVRSLLPPETSFSFRYTMSERCRRDSRASTSLSSSERKRLSSQRKLPTIRRITLLSGRRRFFAISDCRRIIPSSVPSQPIMASRHISSTSRKMDRGRTNASRSSARSRRSLASLLSRA